MSINALDEGPLQVFIILFLHAATLGGGAKTQRDRMAT